ncbi:type II toxin-antitoxin system prevent-host-death family antitoxin [Vulcanococcus limneticus Candia 3F8]|uniref:prevent-host-death family protein n=1 Tax=Vulcanococcus limneticus TaxID=2170428 RepID=UPI000B97DA31|nr:prevent-host-death family protein [Vulcanococcus limneticus]MCP9895482.1 type II toxin-antitoxin system prevent-host-death family antitoxin [Vulcanococcus limneticus Candia 3F8]MCP9898948.1 type II toxin-antitoxin system prevent-host-death family antitoxin [Vulcanococcus limneticus Candia 3B3]
MAAVVTTQGSVLDLKTHLSAWLSRPQAGDFVQVTSHRKRIARIKAIRAEGPAATTPLQQALDAGIVSWNGQKPVLAAPVRLQGEGKLVSAIVLEDRG